MESTGLPKDGTPLTVPCTRLAAVVSLVAIVLQDGLKQGIIHSFVDFLEAQHVSLIREQFVQNQGHATVLFQKLPGTVRIHGHLVGRKGVLVRQNVVRDNPNILAVGIARSRPRWSELQQRVGGQRLYRLQKLVRFLAASTAVRVSSGPYHYRHVLVRILLARHKYGTVACHALAVNVPIHHGRRAVQQVHVHPEGHVTKETGVKVAKRVNGRDRGWTRFDEQLECRASVVVLVIAGGGGSCIGNIECHGQRRRNGVGPHGPIGAARASGHIHGFERHARVWMHLPQRWTSACVCIGACERCSLRGSTSRGLDRFATLELQFLGNGKLHAVQGFVNRFVAIAVQLNK